MQSRRHSLIESLMNVGSGMVIAFIISQLAHTFQQEIKEYIWSSFEWNITAGSNVVMTIVLTVVSVIRGYIWRRYFNNIHMCMGKRTNNLTQNKKELEKLFGHKEQI